MFSNYLIGRREGLEATLAVGILVAYLVKTGNRRRLPALWLGVAAAVAASLAVGAVLTFTSRAMSFRAQEAFGGFTSIVAVGFVTTMVFWMRRQASHLRSELHGKVDAALATGTFALALTAFLAVAREGLETALFLWPALQAAGSGAAPATGAIGGLFTAVVVGWLLYRKSVRLNLATFFRLTGAGLVVVAAGVLAYGVHDLQEAAILPGLSDLAFDVSAQVPPSSWYGSILKGIFNFSPATTWLELAAYVGYLVPTMYLFLRPTAPVVSRTPVPTAHSLASR